MTAEQELDITKQIVAAGFIRAYRACRTFGLSIWRSVHMAIAHGIA
jgi:hypothetical protein